ncbi:MAG TPA: OmpA family protein [Micromonosporaceae bacterium]
MVQDLPNRHAVEARLADESEHALIRAGINDARVDFSGRDGTVHVPSSTERAEALAIVRSRPGVRVAHVVVDQPQPAPSWQAGRTAEPPSHAAPPPPPTAQPLATNASPTPLAPSVPQPPAPTASASSTPATPQPATSTPATSAAESVKLAQTALDAIGPIRFAIGSAALTPADRRAVARIARTLRAYPTVRVQIQGYADASGPVATNLSVSEDRAATVFHTLRVLGIPASRMKLVGFGEARPVAPNDSAAHRAENRRVVLVAS